MKAKELSKALNLPIRSVHRWVHYLNLPYSVATTTYRNGLCRDYQLPNYLTESIKLSQQLNKNPYYTTRSLSMLLNVDQDTARAIIDRSMIPYKLIGRKKVYFLSELAKRMFAQ